MTPRHTAAGYRKVARSSTPLDPSRIADLLAREQARFLAHTPGSCAEFERSKLSTPLGVTSSFQHYEPYPLAITSATGAWVTDVDGRDLLDLSMGFGALLVGHSHPHISASCVRALNAGTLTVTPTPMARRAAEILCKRFNLEQVRFANSGTEATMYAARLARIFTGRDGLIKVEGGYHGGYDALTVSAKPDLALAGPEHSPNAVVPAGMNPGSVHVVAYNDAEALERTIAQNPGQIAAFIVEPVLENLGIVLPDEGYLQAVREICTRHGVLLIFDEVKTGLTAGVGGAAARLGVRADLVTLAKSIGGGIPVAAFGGRAEVMAAISDGRMAHYGTFNGGRLSVSAVLATDEVCTAAALRRAERINMDALKSIDSIIERYQLPAHTVGFGVKGALTWSTTAVRTYRDYKNTDFAAAELAWLWLLNRSIITPPGLDEQWLVSLAHGPEEMDLLVGALEELAAALRA
jgi:glutamate-1-semialdehyde 2,1-aminomutase